MADSGVTRASTQSEGEEALPADPAEVHAMRDALARLHADLALAKQK